MKLLKVLSIVLLLPVACMAQIVEVKEGTKKMGKTKLWCFSANYPRPKNTAVRAVEGFANFAGVKPTGRKKGFRIYRGVVWRAFGETKGDYYYKVRSKRGRSTVYFCASKGYDNYVTTKSDPETARRINFFLQKLDGQMATVAVVEQSEAELKTMKTKNEETEKELNKAKKEQAEKEKEVQRLKRHDAPAYDR